MFIDFSSGPSGTVLNDVGCCGLWHLDLNLGCWLLQSIHQKYEFLVLRPSDLYLEC